MTYEEAYEWACERAREEGDVDEERDYDIIETWAEWKMKQDEDNA